GVDRLQSGLLTSEGPAVDAAGPPLQGPALIEGLRRHLEPLVLVGADTVLWLWSSPSRRTSLSEDAMLQEGLQRAVPSLLDLSFQGLVLVEAHTEGQGLAQFLTALFGHVRNTIWVANPMVGRL